jgi:hypothetical protein
MSQPEPGLISRRLGRRIDGRQEVIEEWEPSADALAMNPNVRIIMRAHWIPGIAESGVRLYERADGHV